VLFAYLVHFLRLMRTKYLLTLGRATLSFFAPIIDNLRLNLNW
jgi:hypothetical protein